MATFAVTKNEVITSVPWLVRKLTCTGGSTGLAYDHGEDRAPDMILSQSTEDATAIVVHAVRTDADTLTLSTEGDAADDCEIYLVWLSQATDGLDAP